MKRAVDILKQIYYNNYIDTLKKTTESIQISENIFEINIAGIDFIENAYCDICFIVYAEIENDFKTIKESMLFIQSMQKVEMNDEQMDEYQYSMQVLKDNLVVDTREFHRF